MNQQMNKQMSEFTRTAIDNTSKALATLQEQTDKMTNMYLDMFPWIPEEAKKTLREWDKPYRRSLEEITSAMSENCKKLEELLAGSFGTLQGDMFAPTVK